jgi:hypothetical protein
MKSKLPIVTMALVVAASLPLASAEQTREPEVTPSGQDLVAEAARQLSQQPSVAAKIRHRANLFDRELLGTGTYRQRRTGDKMLVRFDLKLQVSGEITSLQQVNDGTTLWIRRDAGDKSTTGYVNLGKVREALEKDPTRADVLSAAEAIALGGLQQLLLEVHASFSFDEPVATKLGSVPVWELHGRWKPEMLATFFPNQKEAIEAGQLPSPAQLPAHVPDSVTLVLGRDEFIPLFPYRIEYLRQVASSSSKAPGPRADGSRNRDLRSLVTMELYEVRRSLDLDPSLFIYKLEDQRVENWTERFLRRLQTTR